MHGCMERAGCMYENTNEVSQSSPAAMFQIDTTKSRMNITKITSAKIGLRHKLLNTIFNRGHVTYLSSVQALPNRSSQAPRGKAQPCFGFSKSSSLKPSKYMLFPVGVVRNRWREVVGHKQMLAPVHVHTHTRLEAVGVPFC